MKSWQLIVLTSSNNRFDFVEGVVSGLGRKRSKSRKRGDTGLRVEESLHLDN
jgi:hypothetical protein